MASDVQLNLFGIEPVTRLASDLRLKGVRDRNSVARITSMHTALLVTEVQRNASGRPGPNAPTGDYRRSWRYTFRRLGDQIVGNAGTDAPQGLRLENGFVGTDAIGRHYNQRPYPHVGPAIRKIEPQYIAALEAVVEEV